MRFDSEGLYTALTLNFTVSPILLLIAWVLLRKKSVLRIETWRIYRSERPKDPPTFFNFGGSGERKSTIVESIKGSDPWVEDTQGPEVVMYLRFLSHCIVLFAIVGFLCGTVLIPINATSNYRRDYYEKQQAEDPTTDIKWNPGVADWTTRNLRPESNRIWGLFIVSLVVAIEVYAMVFSLMASMQQIKALQKSTIRTARVKDCSTEEEAKKKIPRVYHDNIESITVPRCAVPGMIDAIEYLEELTHSLQYAYAYKEKHGTELLIHPPSVVPSFLVGLLCCCTKKRSALNYYWSEYDKTRAKLREMSKKVNDQKVIGEAFVTFDSPIVCCTAISEISRSDIKEKILQRVWFAPPGSLILWKNLGQHPAMKVARGIVTFLCMFFLTVFWATIIAFLGSADKISAWVPGLTSLMNASSELKGAITAYLPVVVLAILNLILPLVMRYWTEHIELVSDKIQREHRVLRKMFIFSVVSTILLQAALQGFGNSAQLLQNANTTDIVFMFVSMISPSNGYFVVLVVQAAFMGNLVRLLRLGEVFTCPFLATGALTAHQREKSYDKAPFQYSEEYAYSMMMFAFAVIFSVNSPLIPMFAFFFFVVKYIVDRSQLVDGYPKCRPTDLRLVACVIQCILACLTVLQVLGVGVLAAIKMRWDVYYCSCVPIIITIGMHIYTFRRCRHIMGPAFLSEVLDGSALQESAFTGVSGLVRRLIYGSQSIQENLRLNASVAHQLIAGGEIVEGDQDEYIHPCVSFCLDDVVVTRLDMESQSWLVTRSEANEAASSYSVSPKISLPGSIIPRRSSHDGESPDPDDVHVVAT